MKQDGQNVGIGRILIKNAVGVTSKIGVFVN